MTYLPGTKLSYANNSERCIVLTMGNVMVTMVLGTEWREKMHLVDWLIVAEGQELVVTLPSKTVTDIWANTETSNCPTPIITNEPKPIYPQRAVRTKLRWIPATEGVLRHTAIVTKHGILEVYPNPKKFFENEISWRASLPENGYVEVVYSDSF